MLTLHDYELSADAYKARLMLWLLDLPFARIGVDVHPGREPETAAFRALNPFGTVPVLVDGAVTLGDPEAILLHLALTAPGGAAFLPTDPRPRAACLDWLGFVARRLGACEAARLAAIIDRPSGLVDAVGAARAALILVEDRLVRQAIRGEGFLAGPAPSIADIAAFPHAALAGDFGLGFEEFPKLRAWIRRIAALPGFRPMPGIPGFH